MSQFTIIFFNVCYKKQTSSSFSGTLEEAMNFATDVCLSDKHLWVAEIHNRAGFIVRISFAAQRLAVASALGIKLQKYARPAASKSNLQLTLAL